MRFLTLPGLGTQGQTQRAAGLGPRAGGGRVRGESSGGARAGGREIPVGACAGPRAASKRPSLAQEMAGRVPTAGT